MNQGVWGPIQNSKGGDVVINLMFENVVGWGTMLCEQEVMIWGKSVQHEHHGGKM